MPVIIMLNIYSNASSIYTTNIIANSNNKDNSNNKNFSTKTSEIIIETHVKNIIIELVAISSLLLVLIMVMIMIHIIIMMIIMMIIIIKMTI